MKKYFSIKYRLSYDMYFTYMLITHQIQLKPRYL